MTFYSIVFETPLDTRREMAAVRRDGEKVEAILLTDWSVSFDWKGQRMRLTVPTGFAAAPSVPLAFRSFASFWDGGFEAAVAHDWLYRSRAFDGFARDGRALADAFYRTLMAEAGVSWWRRSKNYWAVRLFGGSIYRSPKCASKTGLALS